jgi:hypothetical protein
MMFLSGMPLFLAQLCMSTPLVLAEPPEPTRVAQAQPVILQSEYARWSASLADDYPQLAD